MTERFREGQVLTERDLLDTIQEPFFVLFGQRYNAQDRLHGRIEMEDIRYKDNIVRARLMRNGIVRYQEESDDLPAALSDALNAALTELAQLESENDARLNELGYHNWADDPSSLFNQARTQQSIWENRDGSADATAD